LSGISVRVGDDGVVVEEQVDAGADERISMAGVVVCLDPSAVDVIGEVFGMTPDARRPRPRITDSVAVKPPGGGW
jgi:hypothetical protein